MELHALLPGVLVGFSLGLTGGGGAIFAVPLLVYWLHVAPRDAVGVSLAAVAATSLIGFYARWRKGLVEIPTGLLFAAAGMLGAPLGGWLSSYIPDPVLLLSFSGLMAVVAWRMWNKSPQPTLNLIMPCDDDHGPTCRRDPEGKLRWTSRCASLLMVVGLATGVLSGMFGVGGGFVIVPALIAFSGMGMQRAVGTSLMVITLIGVSGVSFHLLGGREIPLQLTGVFVAGGILGLLAGQRLALRLSGTTLQRTFAIAIIFVAMFVITKTLWT